MKLPSTQLAATFLHSVGVSVIRMHRSMDKRPDGDWKQFQSRRATYDEVMEMFSDGAPLGVVTGAVSGNLTMAEIEGRAAFRLDELRNLAHDSGLGELWDKVDQGWKEISPSGGVHWFFRTPDSPPEGNRKLARRPSTDAELEQWKATETAKAEQLDPDARAKRLEKIEAATVNTVVQVLAETRAEGGFVVVAPTSGIYHETGNAWRMARNCSPSQVPDLTVEEADAFLGILRTLDVPIPGKEPTTAATEALHRRTTAPKEGVFGGIQPGDDFEARTDWREILEPHGWRISHTEGEGRYWTRPGKNFGISATTGMHADRDRLYVFTTSTEFESEAPYTKFGAYALLNHGNDFRAAAAELRRQGYGRDPEIRAAASPPRAAAATVPGSVTRQDSGTQGFDPDRAPTPADAGNLAPVVDIATKRKPVVFSRTSAGNAEMFITQHQETLRFNTVSGHWIVWDSARNRWIDTPSKGSIAGDRALQTIYSLPIDTEEERKWRVKSSNASMIRDMLFIAAQRPELQVTTNDLDNLPWELNTPAGPVDLKTGKMLEPTPAKFHTKTTAFAPDFDAPRGPWYAFLNQTFPDHPEMIEYIQHLIGYTLIGEVREHLLIFGHGQGGNGKGVAMEVMSGLLGTYATTTPTDFLMKKPFNAHPEEIARLYGVRMVVCSEVPSRAKFDEGRVKLLTGGDKLSGRFMAENTFDFPPSHQIWATGNHYPKIESGGGESFFRRMKLIPFSHQVTPEQEDPGLKKRLLEDHGPAILAWMIEGAMKYADHGLQGVEPAEVNAATQHYRELADTVKMFVEEECEVTPEDQQIGAPLATPMKRLYEKYKQWCQDNHDTALGPRQLQAALKERYGIDTSRGTGGYKRYDWIELLDRSREYQGAFEPPDEEK